jgi:hypothetical protein
MADLTEFIAGFALRMLCALACGAIVVGLVDCLGLSRLWFLPGIVIVSAILIALEERGTFGR